MVSIPVTFKHHQDVLFFADSHPMLYTVLDWIFQYLSARKNVNFIRVTGVRYMHPSPVHQAKRAVDIRVYRADGELPPVEYAGLENLINCMWDYGNGKHQVCWVHENVDDPDRKFHAHIQVRNETKKRFPAQPEHDA